MSVGTCLARTAPDAWSPREKAFWMIATDGQGEKRKARKIAATSTTTMPRSQPRTRMIVNDLEIEPRAVQVYRSRPSIATGQSMSRTFDAACGIAPVALAAACIPGGFAVSDASHGEANPGMTAEKPQRRGAKSYAGARVDLDARNAPVEGLKPHVH